MKRLFQQPATTRTEAKVDSIAADVKKILEPTKGIKSPKTPDDVLALLEESAALINIGKYEDARIITQKALELAVSYADNIAIARTNSILSVILNQNDKKHDDAIKLLKEALTIFRDAKSEVDIANTLGRLGDTEIDEKNFDTGKAFLVEALEIHKKISDKIGIAQDLLKLGWIDYSRGRDREALDYYDQALVNFLCAYNENASDDKQDVIQGIAGCYQDKGLVYGATGKVADADANYVQALEWMRKTGFQQDIAKLLYILADLKYKEAQYDDGNKYLDEAIQIYESIKNYSWLSRCLQLKGRVLFTIKQPNNAIEVFKSALQSAEKSGDSEQQEDILSTLGNFYLETKKNDKAREYFIKARDVSLKEGLLDGYAASLEHLAHLANLDKNSNERDRLLNEGVQTLEKLLLKVQSESKRAFITGRIGSLYEKMENFQQALGYYQRAMKTYESFANIGGIAKCMASIAQIKRLTGKRDEEFDTYLELKKRVDGSPYYELISTTAIALSNIYMDKGDIGKAKSLLLEAELLCNQYSLGHHTHIQKSMKRLDYLTELQKPQTMSYEQLVKELFELVEWFPEAKDGMLRLWYCGRRESLAGNIRNNAGVKLMICVDDVAEYKQISDILWPYMDLSLMVVNSEYPAPMLDVLPFPLDKKIFFRQGMGVGFYGLTSSRCQSKITGNTGAVVTGMSPGLPVQAHELLLSSSAEDIISRKLFFLPYDRHTAQDKLQMDADICLQFGLISVYLNALPLSESANILLSKSIRLPVLAPDEVKSLRKQIRKMKHSLLQLLTAAQDKVQAAFNDFIFDVENLNDDYEGNEFFQLAVHVLEMDGSLDKSIFTVFVVSP